MQTENRKWATALTDQEFVIVVFDAPHKENAEELIQITVRKAPCTDGRRGPSLRQEL